MSNFNTSNSNTYNTYLNGISANLSNSTNNTTNSTNGTNVVFQTLRSRKTTKTSVPLDERVSLEKAFGYTIQSNTRISQSCDGTIAYVAGCVIVIYDCNNIHRQEFITSPAKKTLTCLAFSPDGRTIATGESGHEPKVRVWDVRDKTQLCEFSGHKFAIDCVSYSTASNSNLLVSVGNMHDMVVNVWNYRTKFKVASNKIACKVKGIAFSQDGSYFVTVGNRHVKFWYLTVSSLLETVPLRGRAAILGDMKNNYFCDVVCGRRENSHLTYAITTNGVLCEFNENRYLSRTAELHVDNAHCIYADDGNLFIGCSNGTILIFRQKILDCISSLSRPHYLGVDVSKGLDTSHVIANVNNPDIKHPDCIALCYDKYDFILSAFYNDHSFYVWDIKDLTQVKKVDSHLFHSASCGSIDTFMSSFQDSSTNEITVPENCDSINNMPADSFITCSSDNTIRVWSMNTDQASASKLKRNIYSKELLKVIYIDNDLSALCEVDQGVDISDPLTTASVTASMSYQAISKSSTETSQQDTIKLGARCIKISPQGHHLATGDRNGNIRIYDLSTLDSIAYIEAHIAEVLSLQYSQPESGRQLLASSSRDRLIHIFDASGKYDLLQIIEDHSAAIAAVGFSFSPVDNQLYIVSCGADKSMMIRASNLDNINNNVSSQGSSSPTSPNQMTQSTEFNNFVRTSFVAEKQTFHDLNIDPVKNHVNTISQDRMIREYSIKDGKRVRQFRGSLNEDGYLLKMDIDRHGQLCATACTDKIVYIWDLKTTECLAYLYGHSENVNDLKFTTDGQHLITVGADGCLFMWRISNLYSYISNPVPSQICQPQLSNSLLNNRSHLRQSVPNFSTTPLSAPSKPPTQLSMDTIFDNDDNSLPAWARKKLDTVEKLSSTTAKVRSSWSTSIGHLETESQITQSTGRSGRAVWGAVLNTSLIAVDSELSSLASTTSHTELHSIEKDKCKSFQQVTPEKPNHDDLSSKNSLKNFENCIQFPSPCVNKEFYQVKQVSIEHRQVKPTGSQRPSWICSNTEDDLIFNLNRLSTEEDSSSDDIETPGSNTNSPVKQLSDEEEQQEVTLNLLSPEVDGCSKNDDSVTPTLEIFGTDYKKILNNNTSPNTPLRRLPPNKACFSLVDNVIKLDCDMENSLRRQSISAKYLLRTAQQKEQSQAVVEQGQLLPQFTPSSKVRSTEDHGENLAKAIGLLKEEMVGEAVEKENVSVVNAVASVATNGEFKIRSKVGRMSTGGGNNFQLLYSHHTESSLSKAKPKQPQQFHSSNNLSKETPTNDQTKPSTPTQSTQQAMKRSPSVSSINTASQDCKYQDSSSSLTSSSATSSTSSIKLGSKSNLAKSSPNKTSNVLNRVSSIENTQQQQSEAKSQRQTMSSNLKKASSMISLNQQNQNQALINKSTSSRTRNSQVQAAPVKESIQTNQFLPPKTVRQVKQRSAERQYTTPDLRSHVGSMLPAGKSSNMNSINTFSEQNKHLRKLSNSIQNLHQANKNAGMPPQVPVTKVVDLTKSETNEKTEQLIKPQSKEPIKDSDDLDLLNKLNKLDTDQMSLSSSSVECLEIGTQNDHLDPDLDLNNQPHSSSHTSNSLTSSSSSSCSLFDNQQSNTERDCMNDLKDDLKSDLNEKALKDGFKSSETSGQRCNDSPGFNLSGFSSSNGLKKPVTFASIKAANSPKTKLVNTSPTVINYTQNGKNGGSINGTNEFRNDPFNEYLQDSKSIVYSMSQWLKNLPAALRANSNQSSQLTEQTRQQLQLQNQQIEHQAQMVLKQISQINNVLNASKLNTNETNSSELELA